MKRQYQPCTQAALYGRVSSDRQDVDLSVSAQLQALKDYARANGYSVARKYGDEAESSRVGDRSEFGKMIEEGPQPRLCIPEKTIVRQSGPADREGRGSPTRLDSNWEEPLTILKSSLYIETTQRKVRSTVRSGPPNYTKSRTFALRFRLTNW